LLNSDSSAFLLSFMILEKKSTKNLYFRILLFVF